MTRESLIATMGPGEFKPPPKTEPTFDDEKREMVLKTIEENGGSVNKASVRLGIKASSLRRMIDNWAAEGSQPTISAYKNTTRQFYESIKSPWRVVSVDAESRKACVEIKNRSTTANLSYDLPARF